jgi:hypothetical protein
MPMFSILPLRVPPPYLPQTIPENKFSMIWNKDGHIEVDFRTIDVYPHLMAYIKWKIVEKY